MLLLSLLTSAFSAGVDDMPNNAMSLAKKLGLGWNLGNSLEACNGADSAGETLWGNPQVTREFLASVKKAGFRTIRIPCAWSGYIDDAATYHISEKWLARVAEVVGYCVDLDLYAILNDHWDGGWLEEHPKLEDQPAVLEKERAIWTQIADYFKDFDEHLLFAGMNEVRDGYGTPTDDNIAVHQSYLQAFIDTVRKSGGNNQYRNLVIQGYRTDIALTVDHLTIPTDPTAGRLFVEIHFYDPWDFCGEGGDVYLWGQKYKGGEHVSSWGQEDWVDEAFGRMKTKFVDRGYPVILGEFSVTYRKTLAAAELTKHIDARNYYLHYVAKAAYTLGITPCYWDNGDTGDKGCGLFDRATGEIVYEDALDSILTAEIDPWNGKK
jgi:endoglucanase